MRHKRRPFISFKRPVFRALALAYALLLQAILGQTIANAHAFAQAQHEALGLGVLCLEDGRVTVADPGKSAPAQPGTDIDHLACQIACSVGVIVPALPEPSIAGNFVASFPEVEPRYPTPSDDRHLPPARFSSDLANRAPPTALI